MIHQFSWGCKFKKHESNCSAHVEERHFTAQLWDQQGHQQTKVKDPGFPTRLLMAIPLLVKAWGKINTNPPSPKERENSKNLSWQDYLKQGFKFYSNQLRIFFSPPSFWEIVCMLDHHRHCPFRIKDQKIICYSSSANSCYSSKNSSIPEQVAAKYLHFTIRKEGKRIITLYVIKILCMRLKI